MGRSSMPTSASTTRGVAIHQTFFLFSANSRAEPPTNRAPGEFAVRSSRKRVRASKHAFCRFPFARAGGNVKPASQDHGEYAPCRQSRNPVASFGESLAEERMELHQIRYFLAVANTRNFTRAAEQCNVTQPALTKRVQRLEQELGGQLIFRERQLTHLTDLGKEVLPMLERTLASAEAVRRRAQEFQRKEVAPLRIGLAPSISASLVLDPIAEIAKFVPGLHVELREGAAEKLVDL